MLSASRWEGVVLSFRIRATRFSMVRRSLRSAVSGKEGFCPWRYRIHGLFPAARSRSPGFMDQYHTSTSPTLQGCGCQPYQPSAPNMVGYCLRPFTVAALTLTASIIFRHASTYFGSPVTHNAL